MEVPRPEVKLELQLQAYPTATATPDPSPIYNLPHSFQRGQILNPLSEVRDQTRNLMDTGCVLNLLSHKGNSLTINFDFIQWYQSIRTCHHLHGNILGKICWQISLLGTSTRLTCVTLGFAKQSLFYSKVQSRHLICAAMLFPKTPAGKALKM